MSETTVAKKKATRKRRAKVEAERPDLPHVTDAQAKVLCAIAHLMDLDELWRSPTNTEVAGVTGLAMATVSQHVANLIEAAVLIRPQRRPWHYKITPPGRDIVDRVGHRFDFGTEA